jgi:Zn-dependent M28 family amino/carboxypeptidase
VNIPRTRLALGAVTATALALGTVTAATASGPDPRSTESFRDAVSIQKISTHLEAFQAIADEHGDRAAGTPGYEASADYVEGVLADAGYQTRRQQFPFLYFELLEPEELTVNSGADLTLDPHVMSGSPSTGPDGVTGDLVAPKDPLGCTAAAWDGVDATGRIALVSRGTCPFLDKSKAAAAQGAAAVIVYNNGPGTLAGTLGNDPTGAVPSAGLTQDEGKALLAAMATGTVNVTLTLVTVSEERETFNILAETRRGSSDSVVMLGGHLDSVHDGPGINDNGSGVSTLLTTATELAKVKGLEHQVRFAFWGAEESGLVGSTHYVNDLVKNDRATLDAVATYLNFDMIGSPNYIIATYDADESTHDATATIPPGSAETEDVFTDYFDAIGQAHVDYPYSGRSDYQAFINNGVAAGGLSTGSDGVKTAAQAALFGGTAGVSYDPNYHSAGDDIDNVNLTALDIMSDAVAHATLSLARSTDLVTPGASGSSYTTTKVAAATGTTPR